MELLHMGVQTAAIVPQTGDDTPIGLLVLMMVAGLVVLAALTLVLALGKQRKKRGVQNTIQKSTQPNAAQKGKAPAAAQPPVPVKPIVLRPTETAEEKKTDAKNESQSKT